MGWTKILKIPFTEVRPGMLARRTDPHKTVEGRVVETLPPCVGGDEVIHILWSTGGEHWLPAHLHFGVELQTPEEGAP